MVKDDLDRWCYQFEQMLIHHQVRLLERSFPDEACDGVYFRLLNKDVQMGCTFGLDYISNVPARVAAEVILDEFQHKVSMSHYF